MQPQRDLKPSAGQAYLRTELDLAHLSSPFGLRTNWCVITGAACSGKTTLITALAQKGYRTIPEIGRMCFERELAKGRTPFEILETAAALEHRVADIQLRVERTLPPNEVIFLDRGLPDVLTYCRVMGVDPNEILGDCFHHRYAFVFLLDRFFVKRDGVRFEDDAMAAFQDAWLVRDYSALGYEVERVPVMSRPARVAYVLATLSAQGLVSCPGEGKETLSRTTFTR